MEYPISGRFVLYVESDDHAGNVRGLLSPHTLLPDDDIVDFGEDEDYEPVYYTPQLRKWQEYLWKLREQNLEKLVELANGDPIVYLHLGDITQGKKYPSDWVTTREGDQFLIAIENHRPIMRLPNLKVARYVEGTSSHVFGDGTSEQIVTNQLKAEFPNIDIAASVHGLIDVYGFTTDYSHHGPGPGSRKWLEGNIATYYLRDHMISTLLHGEAPPKLYLRAHYHTWVKAMWNISIGQEDHTSYLCLMPSMCGIGAYGRQVTKSIHSVTNGALAIEVIDGDLFRVHRWTRSTDLRRKEIIR